MGEQHAQVTVAAFGDAPEVAGLPGTVFTRGEPEPSRELSGTLEGVDVGDGGDHGGSDDDADARDGEQSLYGGMRFGELSELPVELFDSLLEGVDLLKD